jgi:(R,R)-butanediol dehydrogenase/meso-butanediol dehydrogenase/diacetyl reductase
MGARATIEVDGAADDIARIRGELGGSAPAVVFEVSGSRSGLRTALELAGKGTRVVLVGFQHAPAEIDLAAVTLQEMSLIGTNALVREIDFPRAVELIARRAGRWDAIAPRVLPMSGYVELGLRPMSEGRAPAIKTLVDPLADIVRAAGHSGPARSASIDVGGHDRGVGAGRS